MKKKGNKMTSMDIAEIMKYKEIVKSLPDIRQDKVEAIKKKIESGEYKIDSKKVARKMIRHFYEIDQITNRDTK